MPPKKKTDAATDKAEKPKKAKVGVLSCIVLIAVH